MPAASARSPTSPSPAGRSATTRLREQQAPTLLQTPPIVPTVLHHLAPLPLFRGAAAPARTSTQIDRPTTMCPTASESHIAALPDRAPTATPPTAPQVRASPM